MAELKLPSVKISESELLTRYGFSSRGTGTECLKRLGWEGKEPFLTRDRSAPPGPHCPPGLPNPWRQDSFCFVFQILRNCWTSVILHRVFKNRIAWVLRGCRMNDMGETFKAKFFEVGWPTRSLPVEVEGLGVPRLHLGQLVADDLHQHGRELHLQGLGLTEGVEAEFQQVAHQIMHGVQKFGQLVEPLPALPRIAGAFRHHLPQFFDVICPHFFKRTLAFEAILWNCA